MYDEESHYEVDLSATGMDDRVFALVLNDLIRENRKHEIAKLDLGENHLTQVPREIEQLNKIDHLVLDDNEFTVFPINVISLRGLANLSLSDNGITIIPNEITVLRDLECLDVSNNMITTIPDNVVRKVQDIEATGNPIQQEEAQRLEALNENFNYDMSYFEEQNQDIPWEEVLDKIDILSPQIHNDAKLVINKSDGLKDFISNVNLERNKEIMNKGLSYMLNIVAKEGIESALVSEMIGSTGNCATPVNDLVVKYYALAMQSEGKAISEAVMMRLAIDFAIKENNIIKQNETEGQEKRESLVDYLMSQKIKDMPEIEKMENVSNHTNDRWANDGQRQKILKCFCRTDENGNLENPYTWDGDKYDRYIECVEEDVLHRKEQIDLCVDKIHNTINGIDEYGLVQQGKSLWEKYGIYDDYDMGIIYGMHTDDQNTIKQHIKNEITKIYEQRQNIMSEGSKDLEGISEEYLENFERKCEDFLNEKKKHLSYEMNDDISPENIEGIGKRSISESVQENHDAQEAYDFLYNDLVLRAGFDREDGNFGSKKKIDRGISNAGGVLPIDEDLYNQYRGQYESEYKFTKTEDMSGLMYHIEKVEKKEAESKIKKHIKRD
jgi:hypothetical protein